MGLFRPRLLILALALGTAALQDGAPPSAAPAAGAAAEEESPPPAVRFVEPRPPALVRGTTRITVEAAPAEGARIARVEIYADDALLSVLETPPFTLVWDAGPATLVRRLAAVAVDSRGRSGRSEIAIAPLRVGQRETIRLVTVRAAVRDARGRPVDGLKREDFTVLEDGVVQSVVHFSPARAPLTAALLVDASNSMNLGGRIDLARRAAEEFVDAVDRADRLLVLHFNDTLRGDREPTSDRGRLKKAIAGIDAGGGTALYDAIAATADLLGVLEGRRVLILLSDGRDQALDADEPGSLRLFEEALEKARRSEAAIYAVGLGRRLETERDLRGDRTIKEILDALALQTGGRSFYPDRPGRLPDLYRQIAVDLASRYTLDYVSSDAREDGRWRTIEVRVRDPLLRVEARAGYYASAGPDG